MIINNKFAYMAKQKFVCGTIPWTICFQKDVHLLAISREMETCQVLQ